MMAPLDRHVRVLGLMLCTTAVVLALLALVPQNRSKLEALVGEPALAHDSITTSHDGPSAQSSLDILSQVCSQQYISSLTMTKQAGLSVSATSTMTLEGEDGCEEFPAEELNLALCSDEFAAMADETGVAAPLLRDGSSWDSDLYHS